MKAYNHPLYYEIAFGFIDAKKQVDLFERFIKKHSRIPVKRVLDLGCGPSLQLRELAKRGYKALGLDRSTKMLNYLRQKAHEEGCSIQTVKADLARFTLPKKVDFAICMMGTIALHRSNEELLSHLGSVAACLRKGGLYVIENLRIDWASKNLFVAHRWTMKRDGIQVRTTYEIRLKDALRQTAVDTMTLRVNDHGKRLVFTERDETKLIFPQEFLALVALNGKFEFLGWFERNRMRKLTKANLDNITLLRRK